MEFSVCEIKKNMIECSNSLMIEFFGGNNQWPEEKTITIDKLNEVKQI